MIGIMHSAEPYGHLLVSGRPPTDTQLAALARCPQDQIPSLLDELGSVGVFSRTRTGVIYSRRMTRAERKSKDGRTAQKTGAKVPGSRRSQAVDKSIEKSTTYGVVDRVVDQPPSPQKPDKKEGSVSSLRSDTAAGPLDLKREVWDRGKRFLMRYGKTKEEAGALIGGWRKRLQSDGVMMDVLSKAEAGVPAGDVVAYIEAIMARSGGTAMSSSAPERSAEDQTLIWRAILTVWKRNGCRPQDWPEGHSVPPGEPGCQVPEHLLREFNVPVAA